MTVYTRNSSIEAAPMQGEAILFDPGKRKFCVLNGTAAVLWERLATPASVTELATELRHHFDVPEPGRAERDVEAVLRNLEELSLVIPSAKES